MLNLKRISLRSTKLAMPISFCLLSCCGSALNGNVQADIDQLQKRQKEAQVRLQDTLVAVSEAEQRQVMAAKRAQLAECRAQVMEIGSEAAEHVSRCSMAHASAANCQAQVSKSAADTTLLGCLFGIGAAALSGGAAAPVALVGCGLGRTASMGADGCPDANCDPSEDVALQEVLQAHNLPTLPMCGGEVGAVLSAASANGVHVDGVVAGMTAANLGIAKGDVLFSVDDIEVVDAETLRRALSKVGRGGTLQVRVYRNAQVVALAGSLEGDKLGIEVGESQVVEGAFVRVTAVAPGSGAHLAQLLPGDRLVRIGPAPVSSVTGAYGLLTLAEEGSSVPLAYERSGRVEETTVTLGPRSSLHAF